jgi:tRNA(fMet)-specific endonuclease VapC
VIVLDTDVISELMRRNPAPSMVARLGEVPAAEQCTTAVTIGELAYGARKVGRPELYERALVLLGQTRVLSFDREAAEAYGRIRSDLERRGTRLADPDLRIAATALVHRATVITGNVRHFSRVPGLSVEDWLRA